MSKSDISNTPEWLRLSPELEHFDPFEGLVDLHSEQSKNVRYGFVVCKINLVFEQSLICEVIQKTRVFPIPNTANWIKGLINFRGNLVPVFNLYDYWGIKDKKKDLPLLVMGTGDNAFGIYADSYPQALEIDDETARNKTIPDSISAELRSFISHSYELNNNTWYETDIIEFIRYLTRDYSDQNLQSEMT